MHSLQHKAVELPDPSRYTDAELARHADYYLFTADTLPRPWQIELLTRFVKTLPSK